MILVRLFYKNTIKALQKALVHSFTFRGPLVSFLFSYPDYRQTRLTFDLELNSTMISYSRTSEVFAVLFPRYKTDGGDDAW